MVISPTRRPLVGVDLDDLEQVQTLVLQAMEAELLLWGRVIPRLVLLGDGTLEDLRLDHPGPGGEVAATFEALRSRPGVRHRIIRRSELAEGTRSGTAVVYGAVNDERGTWWSAERPFTLLPGRLAAPGESWTVAFGDEHDGLPPSWYGSPVGASPWTVLPAQSPVLRARMEAGDWPPGMPRLAHPIEAGNAAAALAEGPAWREGLDGLAVFVFRGRRVERWQLLGDIPEPYHDAVRAVVSRGPRPDSVAVMRLELFTAGPEPARAVVTVGEADGVRIPRVLAMRYTADGGDDVPDAIQYWGGLPQPVGDEAWIGEAPQTPITLIMEGESAEA